MRGTITLPDVAMVMIAKYLALTIGVVVLIGVGAYAPMILGGSGSGSHTSTVSSTCTTRTGTSTTTTTTTSETQGSFTYSPSSPIKVLAVTASTYPGGNGTMVTFAVAFENIGTTDIYTVTGCGSSLVATLPPGNTVLKQVTGGPVCLCAEAPTAVPPGNNRTAITPGCWTVDKVMLVHPGTAQVNFTLDWGTAQASPEQQSTSITATFTFA